jgi:hypothetical protein
VPILPAPASAIHIGFGLGLRIETIVKQPPVPQPSASGVHIGISISIETSIKVGQLHTLALASATPISIDTISYRFSICRIAISKKKYQKNSDTYLPKS